MTDLDDQHKNVAIMAMLASCWVLAVFLRNTDSLQLVVGPGRRHIDPTRTSDLIARRSSIAA